MRVKADCVVFYCFLLISLSKIDFVFATHNAPIEERGALFLAPSSLSAMTISYANPCVSGIWLTKDYSFHSFLQNILHNNSYVSKNRREICSRRCYNPSRECDLKVRRKD